MGDAAMSTARKEVWKPDECQFELRRGLDPNRNPVHCCRNCQGFAYCEVGPKRYVNPDEPLQV